MIIEPYDRITFSSFRVPFPLNEAKEGLDIHSKRFIRIVAAFLYVYLLTNLSGCWGIIRKAKNY